MTKLLKPCGFFLVSLSFLVFLSLCNFKAKTLKIMVVNSTIDSKLEDADGGIRLGSIDDVMFTSG
jgi:hypothetical protein